MVDVQWVLTTEKWIRMDRQKDGYMDNTKTMDFAEDNNIQTATNTQYITKWAVTQENLSPGFPTK